MFTSAVVVALLAPAVALGPDVCARVQSEHVWTRAHPTVSDVAVVLCRFDPYPGWSESLWILYPNGEPLRVPVASVDDFDWVADGFTVTDSTHQGATSTAWYRLAGGAMVLEAMTAGAYAVSLTPAGPGEPQSIGSYAVRVYEVLNARVPFDAFVGGVVRPRDGWIRRWWAKELNGAVEVTVRTQSVGSGGHVATERFRIEVP